MELITDWIALWRDLVELNEKWRKETSFDEDHWRKHARSYSGAVKRRWQKPDSTRTFLIAQLEAHPGSSIVDIGAGAGNWSVLMAPYARHVTAVEPSGGMLDMLRENVAEAGADNISIVQGAWPEAQVERHDFSFCSHAMYGVADLPAFIRRMNEVTNRTCFLLMRVPRPDEVMAEAARLVLGQPYDSPNFHVAYNVLLQMGIFANVLLEEPDSWAPWQSESLEAALLDVKRRLGLAGDERYDAGLYDLLKQRLTLRDGCYVWPPGARAALVYWNVG